MNVVVLSNFVQSQPTRARPGPGFAGNFHTARKVLPQSVLRQNLTQI